MVDELLPPAAAEESFESAAPIPSEDGPRRAGSDGEEAGVLPPELDAAVAALPESNRRSIEELFRGRFVAVRRIKPGRLR